MQFCQGVAHAALLLIELRQRLLGIALLLLELVGDLLEQACEALTLQTALLA